MYRVFSGLSGRVLVLVSGSGPFGRERGTGLFRFDLGRVGGAVGGNCKEMVLGQEVLPEKRDAGLGVGALCEPGIGLFSGRVRASGGDAAAMGCPERLFCGGRGVRLRVGPAAAGYGPGQRLGVFAAGALVPGINVVLLGLLLLMPPARIRGG